MKIIRKGNGIQKTIDALADPTPFLEEAGDILVSSTLLRIMDTKKGPDNKPWAPWALSTLKARQKKGNTGQGLLWDTGRLLHSIKYQVQGKQVVVGSEGVPYAKFLQEGTEKMPARPFIGVTRDDRGALRKALEEYLKKATK